MQLEKLQRYQSIKSSGGIGGGNTSNILIITTLFNIG
jgi:hypothetical protein